MNNWLYLTVYYLARCWFQALTVMLRSKYTLSFKFFFKSFHPKLSQVIFHLFMNVDHMSFQIAIFAERLFAIQTFEWIQFCIHLFEMFLSSILQCRIWWSIVLQWWKNSSTWQQMYIFHVLHKVRFSSIKSLANVTLHLFDIHMLLSEMLFSTI